MLFDPRHDKTPNMAGFALFCASKPDGERYHWPDCRKCAVGQYLTSLGIEPIGFTWDGDLDVMNNLAGGGSPWDRRASEWTFGKLSERLFQHQVDKEKV